MDPAQITMLGVGVALAALIVTMSRPLRRDMDKPREGVNMSYDATDRRFEATAKRLDRIERRVDGIDARLRLVENGLSEVKGRLALVEKYILGRTETAAGEAPAE